MTETKKPTSQVTTTAGDVFTYDTESWTLHSDGDLTIESGAPALIIAAHARGTWSHIRLTDPTIAPFTPCKSARRWGECVLVNGHEKLGGEGPGMPPPAPNHVDRYGRSWGVTTGGN